MQRKTMEKEMEMATHVTTEECKNRGSASGFDTAVNQECENLICTHPGENATCSHEGAATAQSSGGGRKRTCEQCFTTFLTPNQITGVLNGRTPESLPFLEVDPYYRRVNSETP